MEKHFRQINSNTNYQPKVEGFASSTDLRGMAWGMRV